MSGRNLGASIRQRLFNRSRAQGRPFQELLRYFAMERFLHRRATSPFSALFVLKGALLLTAWRAPFSRPTMDVDFAARTNVEVWSHRASEQSLAHVLVAEQSFNHHFLREPGWLVKPRLCLLRVGCEHQERHST